MMQPKKEGDWITEACKDISYPPGYQFEDPEIKQGQRVGESYITKKEGPMREVKLVVKEPPEPTQERQDYEKDFLEDVKPEPESIKYDRDDLFNEAYSLIRRLASVTAIRLCENWRVFDWLHDVEQLVKKTPEPEPTLQERLDEAKVILQKVRSWATRYDLIQISYLAARFLAEEYKRRDNDEG